MTSWTSRSIVLCLLLSACPSTEPTPPADESSTGQVTSSTSNGPGTTPQQTTGTIDTSDTTGVADVSTSGSSSGDASTSGSSSDGGTTSGTSTTGGSSSSSSSGDPSTSSTSGGSGSGTAGDPCAAGDGPDFTVTNNGASDYVINGVNDPPLTLVRGCSYTFDVNAPGHPFVIKTVQGTGVGNAYNDGVINNGTQAGLITWDLSLAAPAGLFYNCQFHAPMTGPITIIDPM